MDNILIISSQNSAKTKKLNHFQTTVIITRYHLSISVVQNSCTIITIYITITTVDHAHGP